MKITLIFLGSIAVILGIFAYFAVFGPPTGSYAINPLDNTPNGSNGSSSLNIASDTMLGIATSSLGVPPTASGSLSTFGSSFATPPLTWPEGQSKIGITAISLEGNQMTFTLTIQTGASPECVPQNLRLVADEQGDLNPPNPASFSFPDSGNCNGSPNQTYTNQTTTFMVDPTTLPLLFTTGGTSNIFFEIATTTGNGLNVVFPGTSG